MKIGIVCYPTFGGSGVLATELGKALADKGYKIHFITYQQTETASRQQLCVWNPISGQFRNVRSWDQQTKLQFSQDDATLLARNILPPFLMPVPLSGDWLGTSLSNILPSLASHI